MSAASGSIASQVTHFLRATPTKETINHLILAIWDNRTGIESDIAELESKLPAMEGSIDLSELKTVMTAARTLSVLHRGDGVTSRVKYLTCVHQEPEQTRAAQNIVDAILRQKSTPLAAPCAAAETSFTSVMWGAWQAAKDKMQSLISGPDEKAEPIQAAASSATNRLSFSQAKRLEAIKQGFMNEAGRLVLEHFRPHFVEGKSLEVQALIIKHQQSWADLYAFHVEFKGEQYAKDELFGGAKGVFTRGDVLRVDTTAKEPI